MTSVRPTRIPRSFRLARSVLYAAALSAAATGVLLDRGALAVIVAGSAAGPGPGLARAFLAAALAAPFLVLANRTSCGQIRGTEVTILMVGAVLVWPLILLINPMAAGWWIPAVLLAAGAVLFLRRDDSRAFLADR